MTDNDIAIARTELHALIDNPQTPISIVRIVKSLLAERDAWKAKAQSLERGQRPLINKESGTVLKNIDINFRSKSDWCRDE